MTLLPITLTAAPLGQFSTKTSVKTVSPPSASTTRRL